MPHMYLKVANFAEFVQAKFGEYGCAPVLCAMTATEGGTAFYGYYEEVRTMPDKCLSQPGVRLGVGPRLCEVWASENLPKRESGYEARYHDARDRPKGGEGPWIS